MPVSVIVQAPAPPAVQLLGEPATFHAPRTVAPGAAPLTRTVADPVEPGLVDASANDKLPPPVEPPWAAWTVTTADAPLLPAAS